MRLVLHKLRLFFRLRKNEMVWFVLLFLLSGIARAAILMVPFRHLAPVLGRHYQNVQMAALATQQQQVYACRIGRITDAVSKYTPWESKCLVQAMIARCLLACYHIPFVMHLGVTMPKSEAAAVENERILKAHAWLAVGPWIITGREGHRAFTIVSTFVAPSVLPQGKHQDLRAS